MALEQELREVFGDAVYDRGCITCKTTGLTECDDEQIRVRFTYTVDLVCMENTPDQTD